MAETTETIPEHRDPPRAPARDLSRRGLSRWTWLAAIAGGLLALATLGPIAVAVVMLRCCDSARGPSAGAWVLLTAIVLIVTIGAAVIAGLLATWMTRKLRGRRTSRSGAR